MDQLPSKAQILDWIAEHPGLSAKRDIAKAFHVKGAQRIDLKRLLKELEEEGQLARRGRDYRDASNLPPVTIVEILPADSDGDLFARALEWQGEGAEPRILFVARKGDAAVAPGERILARIAPAQGGDHHYEARLIRKIGTNPHRILGIFRALPDGGRIAPIAKGSDSEWQVRAGDTQGAREGELVEAEPAGPHRLGLPQARIIERLGDPSAPRAVSLIAIHQHGIPDDFPDRVVAEADAASPVTLGAREDLRGLNLVTIDPSDARDHDDAVFAQADPNPANPGGWRVWVAIADVAHYMTPGSALDREARLRGNSTYFPDRVVPMLPDTLSGDLCSLHEGVDRPCLAVCLTLDAQGEKIAHRFTRALMASRASLTYEEVQEAIDGRPTPRAEAMLEDVIRPLYAAWEAMMRARALRQPLDLDLPERKIILTDDGRVASIAFRDRFDAHRVIEEFMILANVAAAEELVRLRRPLLFRVHEEPSADRRNALREVAEASGFTLAKGQVLKTRHLNSLLAQAKDTDFAELLNITTLRAMTQAYYHPENFGHFGLALRSYAHFTSPIRRYSDLVVHRALIAGHGWGSDGLSATDVETLGETAQHISDTERRSMAAERDTTDRYLAAFLSERVGDDFAGRISGVTRFGLFVKLDETGADGLIPIRTLGREFFHFDATALTLMGDQSGLTLSIGQKVTVRLNEAVPTTGGLMLELLAVEGREVARGPQARGGHRPGQGKGQGKGPGRKPAAARPKAEAIRRKVARKRRER